MLEPDPPRDRISDQRRSRRHTVRSRGYADAMKFAAVFTYPAGPDGQARIQQARPEHRQYLGGLREQGKLAAAGPFTDDSGALIIYEAENEEEARLLIEADPFHKAGVFAGCELRSWNQVF
jgi:uncharacterized protein YciI